MSDVQNAGGVAAGEQENIAAADATGEASGSDAGNILGALTDEGGGTETAPPAEDWRTRMAAGDEKELARLKRFASEANFYKAYRQIEKRLSAIPTLAEGATPEEIIQYRQAIGVPETPDGYGITFDPALQPSETDNAMLRGVMEQAHAANVPPGHVKALFEAYQTQTIRAREEQAATWQREFGQTKAELKREYGSDYLRNIKILEEDLDARPAYKEWVLANLNRKSVLQEAIADALARAPEESLYSGDAGSGGKSMDDRISELRDLKLSRKATPSQIAEYDKLYEAKFARDQRRANGRR